MNTTTFFTATGQPVLLGKRIGKGGEGEVYALASRSDVAAKIYTVSELASRQAKIEAMVASGLAASSPLISFPLDLLRNGRGAFAGFTMRLVARHQPLHELYSPGARKAAFPKADYRFLVRTAVNTSRAIGAANRAGCVIGDINHSGILVSEKATVALIDADSFQITSDNAQYLCRVGVPEYTPPELQGQNLNLLRTPNHDAFGLAVVCFQLLFMGRHPFAGRFAHGDIPFERAIKEHRFAYTRTRNVEMLPPPGVPTLADFPPALGQAFEQAFGPSGQQRRPDAGQWVALLEELERGLRICSANPLHRYPQEAPSCPWCRMELTLGAQLFLPPRIAATTQAANPAASTGNWRAIWQKIDAIAPPGPAPSTPPLPLLYPSPSAEAQSVTASAWRQRISGAVLMLIAIALFIAAPQAFLLWLIMVGFGIYKFKKSGLSATEPIRRRAEDIEQRWADAIAQWRLQADGRAFHDMKATLERTKREIEALGDEEKQRRSNYEIQRRTDQLNRYLDKHQIRHTDIRYIGSARRALLASYGIETAADVSNNALAAVPGFGPVNSRPLLEWRKRIEGDFRFAIAHTQADIAAIQAIIAEIANKARTLTSRLAAGPTELARIVRETDAEQRTATGGLQLIHREREQARADLTFLHIPYPVAASPRSPSGGSTPRSSGATGSPPHRRTPTPHQSPPPSHASASTSCPHCGSPMVLRTVRRGRGAGRHFYGCPRYPRCTGTRPYP